MWQVEVFPAGVDEANGESVGIAVHVAAQQPELLQRVRVLHSLAILDQATPLSAGRWEVMVANFGPW